MSMNFHEVHKYKMVSVILTRTIFYDKNGSFEYFGKIAKSINVATVISY
jgi:hypothetical protein